MAAPPHDPLSAGDITRGLQGTRFRHVEVHAAVASTQRMLVEEGGPDGRVVIADHQTAGRGRAGRTWESPPGRSLLMSALLRGVPAERSPLLSLAAGLAVARGVRALCGLDPWLKWPNDVQVGGRKLCGVLGDLAPAGGCIVIGLGVNVHQAPAELPGGVEATSLAIEGARVRRGRLAVAILRELDGMLEPESWMGEYRERCATLGRLVRVRLPNGSLEGRATAVRDDGALVVDGRPVLAADVVHLR